MTEQAPETGAQTGAVDPAVDQTRRVRREQAQVPQSGTGTTVGDQPVASNAEPSTEHDDYATQARDAAVAKMAGRYEEDGDTAAAEKVRERFTDAPDEQAKPGDTAGGQAAPTV